MPTIKLLQRIILVNLKLIDLEIFPKNKILVLNFKIISKKNTKQLMWIIW